MTISICVQLAPTQRDDHEEASNAHELQKVQMLSGKKRRLSCDSFGSLPKNSGSFKNPHARDEISFKSKPSSGSAATPSWVCAHCRKSKVKCVPNLNRSSCSNCLAKGLICVPADSSAKRTAMTHSFDASNNLTDPNFRKEDCVDETQCKFSIHAPFNQSANGRGPAGTVETGVENIQLACADANSDSSCQNYSLAKVLYFTGDLKDSAGGRALEIPCALDSKTARADEHLEAGDSLSGGVSHDYDQYAHLMLWLNDSIPKTRPRHISRLMSSLVNEEVGSISSLI